MRRLGWQLAALLAVAAVGAGLLALLQLAVYGRVNWLNAVHASPSGRPGRRRRRRGPRRVRCRRGADAGGGGRAGRRARSGGYDGSGGAAALAGGDAGDRDCSGPRRACCLRAGCGHGRPVVFQAGQPERQPQRQPERERGHRVTTAQPVPAGPVPQEWFASGYPPEAEAAYAEGFCPVHRAVLDQGMIMVGGKGSMPRQRVPGGWCDQCRSWWTRPFHEIGGYVPVTGLCATWDTSGTPHQRTAPA